MGKDNSSNLSTIIDSDVKNALINFCKQKGLKMRHVIEAAIIEKLEDEIDLQAYKSRKEEETISFEEILKKIK